MKNGLAIVAALLLVASAAHADEAVPWAKSGIDWSQPPPSGPEPKFKPPRPTRHALKNGMAVLVVENHRLPLVSMQLVVADAGGAQDPPGKSGLAAFTAEMLDEGAGSLTALELAARVDELGATLTLETDFDAATVSVSTLARTLAPTIDLLAAVVSAPAFDEKEGVRVLDDWRQSLELRRDEPRRIAALLLRAALYGAQAAYGRPGDGYRAEFATVTLADARRFHAARWTPRAMTLVVVGDVDTKALLARLNAAFGGWKPPFKKATPVKTPAAKTASRLWLVDRPGSEQADARVGALGLPPGDKRGPAAEVLVQLLGGSISSRLNQRLREELGWTYGVNANLVTLAKTGPLVLGSALVTPHAVEGVAEILRIVAALGSADVPADELARARTSVIRELPQRFATNAATAAAFAWLVETGLPDEHFASYAAKVAKVTAKDLRALARSLLAEGLLRVVVAGDAAVLRPGLEKLLGPAILMTVDLTPADS